MKTAIKYIGAWAHRHFSTLAHWHIGTLAFGLAALTSCADEFDQSYEVALPEHSAEYAYLADYAPLKSYVDRTKYPNFVLAGGTNAEEYLKQELQYALINSNFDEAVCGNAMKMGSCVGDDGSMNFATVSDFVKTATAAGLQVYGHTLAWHSQQPVKWLTSLLADHPIEVDPSGAKVVEDYYLDYTTFTSFPYYNMGYAPEFSAEEGLISAYPGGWYQYFATGGVPTVPGTDYTMTCEVKSDMGGAVPVQFRWSWGEDPAAATLVINEGDWEEVSCKFSGVNGTSSEVIFQPGTFEGRFCIRNLKITHTEQVGGGTYMEDLITNGDMEGDDVSCFYTTEPSTGGPHASAIYEGVGKDGSRGVMVQSADNPVNNWDCQFFIRLPEALPEGTKYHVEFDYRSDIPGGSETQAHGEPGSYQHWSMIGSPSFTTEWQHWDSSGTIDASQAGGAGMRTVAFNLSLNKVATKFYFDNIKFEIEKESAGGGIPQTPEEKHDTLVWAMDRWIAGMMEACEGNVKAWDVVNEAISGGGADSEGVYALQHAYEGSTDFFWQDYMGDLEYVRQAVRLARLYGPSDIKLFVNDYNLESDWDGNRKLFSLIEWIKRWEADGVTKIDGIGTQMHISCYMNPSVQESKKQAITTAFEMMAQSGKLIRVSELDMGLVDADGNDVQTADVTEAQHHAMAELYKFVIQEYLRIIPASQQWGICQWATTDSPAGSGWRANCPIGVWDLNYNRKHAYAGFADGLAGK